MKMKKKKLLHLTSPQRNILFREEYYKGTAINNVASVSYIKKELDPIFIEKAVNKVIESNDALRLRIIKEEGKAYQYLVPYREEVVEVVDARDRTIEEIKFEIEELAKTPFTFEESKLYQFKFYLMPNKETAAFLKLHHIIGDAWTIQILSKQIDYAYEYFSQEKEVKLESFSYLNFIQNENKYLKNSKALLKEKEFWEEYLKDVPNAISFKDATTQVTASAIRFAKQLPSKLSKEIDKYCKKNKITPYVFFLTIFNIYMYKTTGKTRFVVGTPLLNRKNFEEKNTAGMFVSTIPLIINIDANKNIDDLYEKIKGSTLRALRYQRYPYEKMLAYSKETTKRNENLFDIIVSFQNIDTIDPTNNFKKESYWGFMGAQQSSFELHVTNYLENSPYLLNFDFREGITSEIERELIFDRFVELIKNVIKDYDKKTELKSLEYIPKTELNIIQNKKINTKNYFLNPIIKRFNRMVKLYPKRIALKFGRKTLTYKELNDKVNVLANYLIKKGIKGNVPVVLLLDRSLEMIISILAVLKTGGYYVPIDPSWPKDRVSYILKSSGAKVILTNVKNNNKKFKATIIDVNNVLKRNDNNKEIKVNTKINDLLYILYTSGSTGKPKGVLISNKNVSGFLNAMYKTYSLNKNDIWTLFHTYTFDFSTLEIFAPLLSGGKLIIISRETMLDPKELLKLIQKEQITILCQTPALFNKLINEEKESDIERENIKLKYIFLGGESVYADAIKPWMEKYEDIQIINGYGPTETTVYSNNSIITQADIINNEIFIGRALPGYKVKVMDNDNNILPVGCIGELYISGVGVGEGYLNDEKLTTEVFLLDKETNERVYRSGDLGTYNDDGQIKYIARNDNQVKIRGFRVELQEIEKAIIQCPDITRVAVVAADTDEYTKTLVGFIETKREDYVEEVLKEIKKVLTPYMIPKLYQFEDFPLTVSGKIDRNKLLQKISGLEEENINKKDIVLPKDKLEEEILDYVKKITRKRKVSVTADFIDDLGMDSLNFMSLVTYLSDYNISVQEANDSFNIQGLAKKIRDKESSIDEETELETADIINKKVKFNLSNVLLTGATGFLGAHILRELIKDKLVDKVYCLIRPSSMDFPEDRIKMVIEEYFTEEDKKFINKIKVVSGDFIEDRLGIEEKDYNKLCKKIKTIVHSGANVKHYGQYKDSYVTNVVGTQNIIKFAADSGAKMAHISTISVGGISKVDEDKYLDESQLNIGQLFFNNIYLNTKYESEVEVLKAIEASEIDGKIFRMGNIMPRFSDGKFQKNIQDNAFLNKVRTILDTKMIVNSYEKQLTDISPVDLCSEAIVSLLKNNNKQTVYHIYNNKMIKVNSVLGRKEFRLVSVEEQINAIKELNNPLDAHLLNTLIKKGYAESKYTNVSTMEQLNENKFDWPELNELYLSKLIKLLN